MILNIRAALYLISSCRAESRASLIRVCYWIAVLTICNYLFISRQVDPPIDPASRNNLKGGQTGGMPRLPFWPQRIWFPSRNSNGRRSVLPEPTSEFTIYRPPEVID